FLWTLRQKQLKKILFPVGQLKKTEVRKLAQKFRLPVAEKKDSQGICFLGEIDLKVFLKHYIKEKKGQVILIPSEVEGDKKDNVIGWHSGAVFSTLGERHGFTISTESPNAGPYYVVGKDIKKNILMVSQERQAVNFAGGRFHSKNRGKPKNSQPVSLYLENANWISHSPEPKKTYTAQVRYHGEMLKCKVESK